MNTCKESFIPPASRYYGLENQGATCYLNSVLQVLYMTKKFQQAVTSKNPGIQHIDLQLRKLFHNLKVGTAQTHQITQKLGISRVHEQRDAAEYFEKILSHTSPEASQIFQGKLMHKNICLKCHTETDTDGPVWSLPLALKDSHSDNYRVVDGIKEFFKTSDVSGDNQMYCDKCDAKVDATMKCVMKHHPEVLVLLLKRFEFDYRCKKYVKISHYVDVPCILKIPEDETYELYGYVDHVGDLSGGHYTATIKCQDDNTWYKFNDTMVTNLSLRVENTMKSNTAYILFYRKTSVKAADTSEIIREGSTNGGSWSDTSQSRKREKHEGTAESNLYHRDKQKNKKKRKVNNKGNTGRKTGDVKHVEERGKIIEKNNRGEGQDNVVQTSQKSAADYQHSEQTMRWKQSTGQRRKKNKNSKQHHHKDVEHVEEREKILRNKKHGEGQDNERVDHARQNSAATQSTRSKKRNSSKQHHSKDVKHVEERDSNLKQEVQITHSSIPNSNTNMTTEAAAETFGGSLTRKEKKSKQARKDPTADRDPSPGPQEHSNKKMIAEVEEKNETKQRRKGVNMTWMRKYLSFSCLKCNKNTDQSSGSE